MQMTKLKITLNGLIEGIESYQNLSIEGKSLTMDSILLAIEGAQKNLTIVRGRSAFWKYYYGSKDKETISDVIEVLTQCLEALTTKIKLANEGAIRGQNITAEQINKKCDGASQKYRVRILLLERFCDRKVLVNQHIKSKFLSQKLCGSTQLSA